MVLYDKLRKNNFKIKQKELIKFKITQYNSFIKTLIIR